MLILPPFQGEGHGAQLLEAVHRFYCGLPKVQDITGEGLSLASFTFGFLLGSSFSDGGLGKTVYSVSFRTESKYYFVCK